MANEHLKRTPTSTGNRKVWTLSCWLKQSAVDRMVVFGSRNTGTTPYTLIRTSSPTINLEISSDGATDGGFEGVKKDVASWYNLVVSIDTTQEDDADRIRYYVNGKKLNYSSTQASVTKNTELNVNEIRQHVFGLNPGFDQYWRGEICDAFLVDGQALTPDVFGFYKDGDGYISVGSTQATDFRPGQWVPKKPSVIKNTINNNGGFGVNGFYLPMNDSSDFGADFHCDPNSIITLQDETAVQPKNGAPTTSDSYVSQLRSDPYAAYLVLAVPGIAIENTNTELVTNGTFNSDISSWNSVQNGNGTISWRDGTVVLGNNDGTSSNFADLHQQVTGLTIGIRYYFSFETSHLNYLVRLGTTGKYSQDILGIEPGNEYKFDFEFEATATTLDITFHSRNNTGDVYFDNISLKEAITVRDYSADIKGSGSNKTLTSNGNAHIDSDYPSYYGSAMSLDGSGDYFDAGSSSDFDFGSEDFTVEYWQNADGFSSTPGLGIWDATNNQRSWVIYQNASGLPRFYVSPDGTNGVSINAAEPTVPTDQWTHFCMERNGSNLVGYVNGVCVGINTALGTQSIFSPADPFLIGEWNGSNYIDGEVQDLRVYKGVAKYKGGFDVPRPYAPVGIETWRAVADCTANNFATWNPLASPSQLNFSDGNLSLNTDGASGDSITYGTIGISTTSKCYFENYLINDSGTFQWYLGINSTFIYVIDNATWFYLNGVYQDQITETNSTGDIFSVKFDGATREVEWYKNGVKYNKTYTTDVADSYLPRISLASGQDVRTNFGQNPSFSGNITAGLSTFTDTNGKGLFRYEPPSGFLALCEDNLPTPAIADPGEQFKTVLWTGDGNSGRSITGVGFKPDLFWVKERSNTSGHHLFDSVRGPGLNLKSNATDAEASTTTQLLSFDSDGFSIGSSGSHNQNGETYVAWCWKAGGAAVSNTDGTITSQVSANQTAGFSIVSYTGNATDSTVGHGLNKAPGFIIVKKRNGAADWPVYHHSLATQEYLVLNLTNAKNTTTELFYQDPTSSVFYIGDTSNAINASGGTYIAYCWTEIEGFSKFGSYAGNGDADGTFVYCGFKPAFVLWKNASNATGYSWYISDSARSSTNPVGSTLAPNTSNIEDNGWGSGIMDFTSNGFKIRRSAADTNSSGDTFIFAAFAESPFKTANAK